MGCQVETFLREHWHSYPRAMRQLNAFMRHYTPQHGPPYEVAQHAKKLRDDICEFRASEKRRREFPRILFFEHGQAVICTNAFFKTSSTPDEEIKKATEMREEYLRQTPFAPNQILKGWSLP